MYCHDSPLNGQAAVNLSAMFLFEEWFAIASHAVAHSGCSWSIKKMFIVLSLLLGWGLVASGYSIGVVVFVAVLGPVWPALLGFIEVHALVECLAILNECLPLRVSEPLQSLGLQIAHRAELDELAGHVAIAVAALIEVGAGHCVAVVFPLDDGAVIPFIGGGEAVVAQGLTKFQFDDDIAAVEVVFESCCWFHVVVLLLLGCWLR